MTDRPVDRSGLPVRPAWTICPECGIGRGADHRKDCSKSRRPPIKIYMVRKTLKTRKRRRRA